MPVSSILKAAGKPASPSHSVETHTLSLHIRHTEKRLIPDTERDDPGTSGATTIAFRPSETVSFPVYIQTGLSGEKELSIFYSTTKTSVQPDTTPVRKGRKGLQTYYSPSSSPFFLRVVLRFFGFSSAGLSTFTPASSGSIRIRPQYSQTMIFLCIFTSS